MESTNIFETNEDSTRSCESRWTMYLASPSHDHNYECYYDDDDGNVEEDSDGGESMESDASSGPMETTTSSLKVPLQEIEEQNSKKKKPNEDMVLVETPRVHDTTNDDEDGDNHDCEDGYSVDHSYDRNP